ncbi:MAG: ATP-dependent DNA helicase RecG [Lachnospiraceae bacterium]|nr:ATP-dependent DNA helicase RecG [Ruminococcus sp.]MCM1274337.1 ATP-dependent DNA helicase RecG [Lachnospiraceae bacterium]
MEITYLKGVGPKKAELYKRLGIETAERLTEHYPRDYVDFTNTKTIRGAEIGEVCAFRAVVASKRYPSGYSGRVSVYRALLTDGEGEITAVFFNSVYTFDKLVLNKEYIFYGKIVGDPMNLQISSPQFVPPTEEGLLPKYPLTTGLANSTVIANMKTALSLVKRPETLPESVLEKYSLLGADEAMRKIHFPKSREEYQAARKRLVFEELLTLKLGLSQLKNRGRTLSGAVMTDVDMNRFYASLPFTPTNAQLNAVSDCVADMKRLYPMNRLIQGDVGSGKTMVAAAAAYFARCNGFTTLVMAPTEVLARQHYDTFRAFLEPLGVTVGLLSGSMTAAEKKKARKAAEDGETEVLIGTHALIQKSVAIKRLGLVIVDEQHRFGVGQRSELAEKGANPHIMAMSATPIPRTLALIVYGDLDVSILNEMPKGRIPIKTYAVDSGFRTRVYNFIKKHIAAGRQAFIVCPRVEQSENDASEKKSAIEYYNKLTSGEFAGIPTGLLYGRMKQADKDAVMNDFRDNKLKLLISTTVIEVGIDVPNAVVMLIENAEQFGLSQLHQLRGRVGRGSEQSFCILLTDNKSEYTRARTKAMVDTTDGYKIADIDLQLRGPGNFFGREQSGLPPMKVADLAENAEQLGEIDKLAAELLRTDARLEKPENAGLRANVEKLFGNVDEYGWN